MRRRRPVALERAASPAAAEPTAAKACAGRRRCGGGTGRRLVACVAAILAIVLVV